MRVHYVKRSYFIKRKIRCRLRKDRDIFFSGLFKSKMDSGIPKMREQISIEPSIPPSEPEIVQVSTPANFVSLSKLESKRGLTKQSFLHWWWDAGRVVLNSVHSSNEAKHTAIEKIYPICKGDGLVQTMYRSVASMPTHETQALYALYDQMLQSNQRYVKDMINDSCRVIDRCVAQSDERIKECEKDAIEIQRISNIYIQHVTTQETFDGYMLSDNTRKLLIDSIKDEMAHELECLHSICEADVCKIRAHFLEQWPNYNGIDLSSFEENIEFEKSRLRSIDHPVRPIQEIIDTYNMQIRKMEDELRHEVSQRCENWLHAFEKKASETKKQSNDWRSETY